MWVAFALIAAASAQAAPCDAPMDARDLRQLVQPILEAPAERDDAALALSEVDWSCLSEVPPPSLAAELHLAQAIAALAQGDIARATAAARGALAADPDLDLDAMGDEIAALLAAAGSLPTPPAGWAEPAGHGALRVDGAPAEYVPTERAALVQIDGLGSVQSWYLPGGPPPESLIEALEAPVTQHLVWLDEMERYAERQVWSGVERRYQQLSELEDGAALTARAHLLAAQAASAEGRMGDCRERLERARELEWTPEVLDWIHEIDASYGQVVLRAERGVDLTLQPATWPFAPEQRASIEHAIADLAEQREFEGMLPVGEYSFGGRSFSVVAGVHVRIEIGPVARGGPSRVGPRLHIGFALTSFAPGEFASEELGYDLINFSGMGPRVGLGFELGLSPKMFIELGYHGASGGTYRYGETGIDDWRPSIRLGYAAMGLLLQAGNLWIVSSPIQSFGTTTVARRLCDSSADCAIEPTSNSINATGFQMKAGFVFLPLGNLSGSMSLGGGALYGLHTRYTWGETSLTFSPTQGS